MKGLQLLSATLLLGAFGHARADSATITVTGKVLPGTCTMADVSIALEDIDATSIKTGYDNGLKPATLSFTGCVGVASIDLSFSGAEDAAQDGHWKNTAVSDAATGVAVALLESTGDAFLKNNAKKSLTVSGAATARLDLRSGYYRKSGTTLKAGSVGTQITVTADYK
jgi:type 1 fimbria pilin